MLDYISKKYCPVRKYYENEENFSDFDTQSIFPACWNVYTYFAVLYHKMSSNQTLFSVIALQMRFS